MIASLLFFGLFALSLMSGLLLPNPPVFGVVAGLAVVFLPGSLAVRWISRYNGGRLPTPERLILSGLLGIGAVAFAATLSYLVAPGHALLVTRILLGIIGIGLFILDLPRSRGKLRKREFCLVRVKGFRSEPFRGIFLIAIALLMVLMLAAAGSRRQTERYTELYIASRGTTRCIRQQQDGELKCDEIGVGIRNQEHGTVEYMIVFRVSPAEHVVRSFTLTHGEERVETVRVPLSTCDDDIRVHLYRGTGETPYRYLRVACTPTD